MKSKPQFLIMIRAHLDNNFPTYVAAAKHYGIRADHITKILVGTRPPVEKILDEMGYTRSTASLDVYCKVDEEPKPRRARIVVEDLAARVEVL